MRVLLDENVPVDIIPILRSAKIEAESVNFLGWKGIQNGELIMRARERYDLMLTRDKDFDQDFLRNYVTEKFGIVVARHSAAAWPGVRGSIRSRLSSSSIIIRWLVLR